MRMKACWLFVIIGLVLSACAQQPNGISTIVPPEADEPTPSPYPDTPSPPAIDAPLIESPALIDLVMFDEIEGWAVSESQIVRTNDGGVTWYNVTPEEVGETGFSVDSFFLDHEHAWIQRPDLENFPSRGFLYRTTDGGLTWKDAVVPFSRGDLYFVDENNGWVLADLGVGAGSNAVAVYQTTDGGVTWQQTYTNDPNASNESDTLPLGGIKSGLVALDNSTAWVGGVVYAPGEVYLFRTDDGGRTWAPVLLTLPDGAENFELGVDDEHMKFVTARDGFLVLRMAGDSTQTAVYVTNDSGNTWTLTSTIVEGAGEAEFLSAQEAILYNGGQFYVTRDASQTWESISPDVAFGESFAGMEFANLTTGWVIALDPTTNHRSLYKTTDGGVTWFPVIP